MTNLPAHDPNRNITRHLTLHEAALIDDLRRCPDRRPEVVTAADWDRPYSREQAAYPAEWVKRGKVWPFSSRIDNVYGDRNLFCVCIPIEEYA